MMNFSAQITNIDIYCEHTHVHDIRWSPLGKSKHEQTRTHAMEVNEDG